MLFVAILLYRSAHTERIQLEQRVLHAATSLAQDIDRDIDRGMALLEVLVTSPTIQQEDWPAFYNQAKAALKERGYIVLQDAKGRQIINTYVPFGEAPEFTGNPESVQQILTTKAPAVSDLFTSLAVKRPVYNISIPIQKGDDIHYILSLGLLPEILAQILRDQQFNATWVSTIWDRKGILMARSRDHERLLGPMHRAPMSKRERAYLQPPIWMVRKCCSRQRTPSTRIGELSFPYRSTWLNRPFYPMC
jgi:hypothetical protein